MEFNANDNDEGQKEIKSDFNYETSAIKPSASSASFILNATSSQRQSLKSFNETPIMSEIQAKAKKFFDKAKTKLNIHSTNIEDKLPDFDNVCILKF